MKLSWNRFVARGAILALAAIGCSAADAPDDDDDVALGDLGSSKSDAFGIADQAVSFNRVRRFTFTASGPFAVRLTQTETPEADRQPLRLKVTVTDSESDAAFRSDTAPEPALEVAAGADENHAYRLTLINLGTSPAKAFLAIRAKAEPPPPPPPPASPLPDPNAAEPPPADWQPPVLADWPAAYVIFNNTPCDRHCSRDDQTALRTRSVMVKMIVAAVKSVRDGGTIRVSNFNISSSRGVQPVIDALLWAMQERAATVRIVMDEAQNKPDSKTTWLAEHGADVRFLVGMTYQSASAPGTDKFGIMHSKMVVVDDAVVFAGSNNFSSSGLITNEENSVVLRAPTHADRVAAFTCQFDAMFSAGVTAGATQLRDTDPTRRAALEALAACNTDDVWFPPSGALDDRSFTYSAFSRGMADAKGSLYLAPDMLAHPGIVGGILRRAKHAQAANEPFRVRVILDGSQDALGNPAFGECLAKGADEFGLDIAVRYWSGNEEIFQLLHHKFMVTNVDAPGNAVLFNGSANFSAKAFKWSFENVARFRGAAFRDLVGAFITRVTRLFDRGETRAELAARGVTVPDCPLDIHSLVD